VVLSNPESELAPYFLDLTESGYALLQARARAVPRSTVICDEAACRSLVEALYP
jgi:hypothetical protein